MTGPSPPPSPSSLPPVRVLVVDDDFMVARLHRTFVERLPGYQVVGTAHTGAQAVAAAQELRPDLVLLDVYLPDVGGLEVLDQLRRLPGADMDVLVISAARDVDSLKRALRGGAVHYLVKPFEFDALRAQLALYARRRHELAAMAAASPAEQSQVDRVFGAAGSSGGRPVARLPKGISQETVDLVARALERAGAEGVTATDCAEQTGLSRSSTRRYLEYLLAAGRAEVQHQYGAAGRPHRRYRLRG